MSVKEKEAFADEIYLHQPHLLASCLVQSRLGVEPAAVEFLLNILFVCYQSMKESGVCTGLSLQRTNKSARCNGGSEQYSSPNTPQGSSRTALESNTSLNIQSNRCWHLSWMRRTGGCALDFRSATREAGVRQVRYDDIHELR